MPWKLGNDLHILARSHGKGCSRCSISGDTVYFHQLGCAIRIAQGSDSRAEVRDRLLAIITLSQDMDPQPERKQQLGPTDKGKCLNIACRGLKAC
jgi:hypothetical protein